MQMGGATVKRKYMVRQGLMILNQLFLIVFLCVMNTVGAKIPAENIVHIVLLTLLFFDGYYISGKNLKGNPVLSKFAILLVVFGWLVFWTISIFCLPPCRCGIHCYSTNLPVSTGELRTGISFSRGKLQGKKTISVRDSYNLLYSDYQLFLGQGVVLCPLQHSVYSFLWLVYCYICNPS